MEHIGQGVLYNGSITDIAPSLPDNIVDTIVTSPPYWKLRNYNSARQLGQEKTSGEYIEDMVNVFESLRHTLKKSGSLWVNIGDTFENKSLSLIPQRFASEMKKRGWIVRNEIIWEKPNAQPDGAKDRFTINYEHLYFFVLSGKYYFRQILEPALWASKDSRSKEGPSRGKGKTEQGQYAMQKCGSYTAGGMKNKRAVWRINTASYPGMHFAVFPEKLPRLCFTASAPENGTVMDPFMGSGTVAVVAEKMNLRWIGVELNSDYIKEIKSNVEKYLRNKPVTLWDNIIGER